MENNQGNECWSKDGETFSHDTLGELIDAECGELRPGHEVWRGTAKHSSASDFVDADSVIEDIQASASDFGDEFADGYPEVSPEHKAKLQTLLEQWLDECPSPRFYRVVGAAPHILTESDFSAEQLAEIAAQEEDERTTGRPA